MNTDAEKIERMCGLIVGGMSKTRAIKQIFGDGRKYWEVTHKNSDFQFAVAQALEIYADTIVDEATEIADTDPDPNRARNRISVRQWHAGKLKPKTYGERMELAMQHSISINGVLAEARSRLRPLAMDVEFTTIPAIEPAPAEQDLPDIFS